MEIRDSKGKYILNVDTKRCIVYEKPLGYLRPDDLDRLYNNYKDYIVPVFRNAFRHKKWVKIVDLRDYKLSMITDKLGSYIRWCSKNGLVIEVLLLDKTNKDNKVIEMQTKLITDLIDVDVEIFYDLNECYNWLKTRGF